MILPWDRKLPGDIYHKHNPIAIRTGAAARAEEYGIRQHAGSEDIRWVDEAIKWLHNSGPAMDLPWVLVVNIKSPHFPHYAAPEFWEMYPNESDLPKYGIECKSAQHPYAKAIRRHFETNRFSLEQARGLRHGYLACISFVDHQLGRLIKALETTGMRDTTNIVYTADHGEMLGKFGMWWKCSLYEDAVRIPLIATGPDFSVGQHVKTPVDLHDLRASLFSTTAAQQPSEWLGTPLENIHRDDTRRIVFSEYHGHGVPGSCYMIRKGRWKYIHYYKAPSQLFDIETDSNELQNLAGFDKDTVLEMETELRTICSPSLENNRAEQFITQQLKVMVLPTF